MLWIWIPLGIVLVFGLVVFRGAPYVPSKKRDLKNAFEQVYPLTKDDLLVDIGSGDGVVLRQVAQRGARAYGIELNPILVVISRILSRKYGDKVRVRCADFWLTAIPQDTTIVYTFGESRDIAKMYKRVQSEANRLNKSLYFLSYGFSVPGVEAVKNEAAYYLYLLNPVV